MLTDPIPGIRHFLGENLLHASQRDPTLLVSSCIVPNVWQSLHLVPFFTRQ